MVVLSAIFDVLSSIVSAFFQVLGALGRGLWDILGAVASAVLWPVRAVGASCLAAGMCPPSGRPCTLWPAAFCWRPWCSSSPAPCG